MLLLLLLLCIGLCSGSVVQITSSNIDSITAENNLVLVNFYADWCRYSNLLVPIWDEAAEKIKTELSDAKVVMGRIDCEVEKDLSTKYNVNKYPTLRYFENGVLAKKEYRGQRSANAILEFVKKEIESPVKGFVSIDDLVSRLDEKKRHVIGYFNNKDSESFRAFEKAAQILKSDCDFLAAEKDTFLDDSFKGQGDTISFRPSQVQTNDEDEAFSGDINDYNKLEEWARSKCISLVREITFNNAEELTEEGLPFLILFHHAGDSESVKKYNEIVKTQLRHEVPNVNFLTADGLMFMHPLSHLGKTVDDLPLIAIDSFKHMYLFKHNFKEAGKPGKLAKFLADLHSGKLHREYHYGPEPESQEKEEEGEGEEESKELESKEETDETENKSAEEVKTEGKEDKTEADKQVGEEVTQPHIPREVSEDSEESEEEVSTDPPESVFAKLGPSPNRYTLLKDEF